MGQSKRDFHYYKYEPNSHLDEILPHTDKHEDRGSNSENYQPHVENKVIATAHDYETHEKRSSRRNALIGLLLFVVLAAVAVAGVWFYQTHRNINITIGGQEVSVKTGSTVAQALEQSEITAPAGRLLSIKGNVLDEKGGESFTVKIDGLDELNTAGRILHGGEHIELVPGEDVVEDSEVVETTIPYTVVSDGSRGAIEYPSVIGTDGKKKVETGKVSGEIIDMGVTVEPVNSVLSKINPQVSPSTGMIALTFDDGPTKYTSEILDILKEYNARATFFAVGTQLTYFPSTAKRAVEEGHQLASHSYDHPFFSKISDEEVHATLDKANAALLDSAGVKTRVFRAPYGDFSTNDWIRTKGKVGVDVGWTIDTSDWKKPGASVIQQRVIAHVKAGDIILMHDGGGNREQTVQAVRQVVSQLTAQGYKFVTINELIAEDGRIPLSLLEATDTPEELVSSSETAKVEALPEEALAETATPAAN